MSPLEQMLKNQRMGFDVINNAIGKEREKTVQEMGEEIKADYKEIFPDDDMTRCGVAHRSYDEYKKCQVCNS